MEHTYNYRAVSLHIGRGKARTFKSTDRAMRLAEKTVKNDPTQHVMVFPSYKSPCLYMDVRENVTLVQFRSNVR